MVHGGAGAGKSHVINNLAEWIQLILLKPGDNIDCPYVIVKLQPDLEPNLNELDQT